MMGVAELVPGILVTQSTFCVAVHCTGRFVASVEPLWFGPRQFGQFAAWEGAVTEMAAVRKMHIGIRCFEFMLDVHSAKSVKIARPIPWTSSIAKGILRRNTNEHKFVCNMV